MISDRRQSRDERGFTLFELILVLAIAVILLTALPGVMTSLLPGLQYRAWLDDVAAESRLLRARAMRTGHITYLAVEAEKNIILSVYGKGDTRLLVVPADVALTVKIGDRTLEKSEPGRIRFFADGSSSGGELVLVRQELVSAVRIDWLTGAVNVARQIEQ